jgi:hypothetical protein
MATRLTNNTVAEERAQRASRRMGGTLGTRSPSFETRSSGPLLRMRLKENYRFPEKSGFRFCMKARTPSA